jgi:CheY-like chemotaxis protein
MAPKRILLAEDDADDQMLFSDFLFHRSDILLMPIAENGSALSDSLENIADPGDLSDIIILDQNMPKKNGVQTLQLLKASDR